LGLLPGGGFVLLRTETTPELEAEGIARDAIRAVQEARKNAGLDVSDRIVLLLAAAPELAAALETHADLIAAETLATGIAVRPDAGIESAESAVSESGAFVTSASALGTEKATLGITIDVAERGE
ncbi:MAG: isoleucine--tRNA ligase, partial [Actinobacteria bacterium]|nr:isoleucine--tRNA ligase [Actinomycetota bacterium]